MATSLRPPVFSTIQPPACRLVHQFLIFLSNQDIDKVLAVLSGSLNDCSGIGYPESLIVSLHFPGYHWNHLKGDFNTNYFNDDEVKPLKAMMNSFYCTQVVQSPTFISSGSLLDHVYVRSCHGVEHSVIPVYYSDHNAVKDIMIADK